MRNRSAGKIAFGGVMAALAAVIMCLGGLIPASTYVCPMLAVIILNLVQQKCGKRIGWAWFGAVCLLTVLMGPDKEAAGVFVFLGYYPLIKNWFDSKKCRVLLKAVYFSAATLILYAILIRLLGLPGLEDEFSELGTVMTVIMLIAGNFIFLMLDRILGIMNRKMGHGRK